MENTVAPGRPEQYVSPFLTRSQMALGLGTVALTFWGTVHFKAPFYPHAYLLAWYGLILFLDGLLGWKWGEGFILTRPWEFATLLFWSTVIWFFFEIWNLRLKNWYYVGVSSNAVWAQVETYLDFATVLPGMFLVYRVLCRLQFPRNIRTSFVLSKKWNSRFPVIGLIMIVLPVFFPDYFYPLLWGSFFFLLEPLCASHGAFSLLREAQDGEWTTLFRLLAAGLICGIYWEFWNYWSLAKWVYTVPFLPKGKLFEMPYAGFIGFPPFCVECYAMVNAVYLLRNGKHWIPDPRRVVSRFRYSVAVYPLAALVGLMLSQVSYQYLNQYTVDSRAERVSETIEDIAPIVGQTLLRGGWYYPLDVLKHWDRISPLIESPLRERIHDRLELATHLQMGSINARLLEAAGIHTLDRLALQDPTELFDRLVAIETSRPFRNSPLVKRRIKAWVWGAKRETVFY